MKVGFSSLVCPGWDLGTIVENASSMGFDGVELRGLRGDFNLPGIAALSRNPDQVRTRFASANVELICLASSATLDSRDRKNVAANKAEIVEFMELAAALECPFVRLFVGEVQRWDKRDVAIARIAEAITSLVPVVTKTGVTLLIENGGDFPGSDDMWFLADAVAHPGIRICWNQCTARSILERATSSIPRLGAKIGLVHLCDAKFDDQATLTSFAPLGEGDVEIAREVELLRGMAYDGYLVFEWPKMWAATLPPPETSLPQAATFMRGCVDARQGILSAYKADKNAPQFRSAKTA